MSRCESLGPSRAAVTVWSARFPTPLFSWTVRTWRRLNFTKVQDENEAQKVELQGVMAQA
jgi:hypothetical protein